MSLDEMIRFLNVIHRPFNIHIQNAYNFHVSMGIWEKRHRPED